MDFLSYSKRDALVHRLTYDYSCADWDGHCDHLRYVPWKNTFKLDASAATCEFCEWVQVGIGVYIRSSLTHFHLHAAAIAHRNHFLCVYQQNKSSESKVKFWQASNSSKSIIEVAKLTYANKTKESVTSPKLGFQDNC